MIAGLKPYPEMRDSGVPWLGDVPDHWRVERGIALVQPQFAKNVGLTEKQVLSLSYGRIIVKPEEKLRGLVPESFETYQHVFPDDIIVRATDLQNDKTSLRVAIARDRGIITSAYLRLAARDGINPEYAYRLLHGYDLMKVLYGYGSGLRQNLEEADFKQMPVPIPSRDEQTAIVRFLDHADRRIRRSIAAKQKLVRLLEEQQAAIVHQAVTRGLNPDAVMKPSGVEWLGDIPAHWQVVQLRRLFRAVFRTEAVGDEPKMSLSRSRGFIRSDELGTRAALSASSVAMSVCVPGDLVMNKYQAQSGLFGSAKHRGLVTANYTVFRPLRGLSTDYFRLLLTSRTYNDIFMVASRGIGDGMMPLYNSAFYATNVPEPPIEEQIALVRYVDQQVAATDRTIAAARREIELLQEYRTRLVADVVTGKLDVRAAAARLPYIEPEQIGLMEEADIDEDVEASDPTTEEEFA